MQIRASAEKCGLVQYVIFSLVIIAIVVCNNTRRAYANPFVTNGVLAQFRGLTPHGQLYHTRGALQTQVPVELINNRPIIRVRLNSSDKIFRFVLDTGADLTVVSTKTAARLNLKKVRTGGLTTGLGGSFASVYGLLWSLEIGKVRIDNVPVVIRPLIKTEKLIDGWLGVSLLAQFVASLDYGERVLMLERKANRSQSHDRSELPLSNTPFGLAFAGVRIHGVDQPLSFIIDTAASISALHNDAGLLPVIDTYQKGELLEVSGAAGIEENVATAYVPTLRLGLSERSDFKVVLLDLKQISRAARSPQMGILGGDFLRHFRIVFDMPNKSLRLYPLTERFFHEFDQGGEK